MQIEWEGSLRVWAQRKGLAEFEHWLAEKGEQEGITVDWQQLQVRWVHLYGGSVCTIGTRRGQ